MFVFYKVFLLKEIHRKFPFSVSIKVPFLSATGDLGWREVVSTGVSELSGEYCVENVRGEDGELYRRLVFISNTALIQSENRLISPNTGQVLFCTVVNKKYFPQVYFRFISL